MSSSSCCLTSHNPSYLFPHTFIAKLRRSPIALLVNSCSVVTAITSSITDHFPRRSNGSLNEVAIGAILLGSVSFLWIIRSQRRRLTNCRTICHVRDQPSFRSDDEMHSVDLERAMSSRQWAEMQENIRELTQQRARSIDTKTHQLENRLNFITSISGMTKEDALIFIPEHSIDDRVRRASNSITSFGLPRSPSDLAIQTMQKKINVIWKYTCEQFENAFPQESTQVLKKKLYREVGIITRLLHDSEKPVTSETTAITAAAAVAIVKLNIEPSEALTKAATFVRNYPELIEAIQFKMAQWDAKFWQCSVTCLENEVD